MLTTNISTNVIIGMALVEILNGELTNQTIAAVGSINYREVPPPLNHLVGYIQGMNTDPAMRPSQITSLMAEIATIGEWLMSWANEVHDISRIIGIALFVELSAVVTEGEQSNGTTESIWTPRETARLASQASQIMS